VALEGQATWLRTRVVEGGFDSGPGALLTPDSALLRRPSFTVAGNLRHAVSRRVRATLSARHVGARADLDYTGYPPARVVLPAYGTVSLSLEGDVLSAEDRSVTLTARVEDLFDTPYQEVVNFPARRRTVWLGARARF
jgi:outer membrane cobalamin receptor